MKTRNRLKVTGIILTIALLAVALGAFPLTASAEETFVAWADADNDGALDSSETKYSTISEALTAGGTIRLMADYTFGENDLGEQNISMSSGTATLDLNGRTLAFDSIIEPNVIVLSGTADLTITDSKSTGVIEFTSRKGVELSDSSRLTFAGGTFMTIVDYAEYVLELNTSDSAVFRITGGKHYSNPTDYLAANHKIVMSNTDPKYTVVAITTNEIVAWNDADNDGVINNGEQAFNDMDTALAAGVDLKMNSDIFRDSMSSPPGSLEITSTKTVDLNGYSIVTSAQCFEVTNGTLTIKDSAGGGQLLCQNDDGYAAITVHSGSGIGLIVEGGTILGDIVHYGEHTYPDAIVLNGGSYSFDPSSYIRDDSLTAGQDMSGLWGIRENAENACTVEISGTYIYKGADIIPTIVVKDGEDNVLSENVDYTVSLTNNTSAGTATATVTFVNDYRGSISRSFTIEKATPQASDFFVFGDAVYDGNPHTANVNTSFVNESDITVKHYDADGELVEAPTAAGTYTVKIDVAANLNYNAVSGLEIGTFVIDHLSISTVDISVSEGGTYNGEAQVPAVTVTGLTEHVDYTLSWDMEGFINAGNYTVTVTGIGNYNSSVERVYVIAPKPILDSDVTIDITEAYYDGFAHIPTITVKDGDKILDSGTDYTVTWDIDTGFILAYIYEATINGNGNYSGVFNRSFRIYETAPEITITSPSPSIMPGMTIMFDIVVVNPHNENADDLPIHYRYVYKVGESGELNYSTQQHLTIPASVMVGDTVYVYVENYEEPGRYSVAMSNLIELFVGQVDYSGTINGLIEDIDEAKADLQAKIDEKADASALATAVTNLNEAIISAQNAAQTFAQNADAALKTELETAITGAKTELSNTIEELENKLDEEVLKLQNMINSNVTDINTQITTINGLINTLEDADRTLEEDLSEAITKAENELSEAKEYLENKIDGVQDNLDDVEETLNEAITNLEAAMMEKDEDLTREIGELNDALTAAKAELEQADTDNKAELESQIRVAQATLNAAIKAVQQNLDEAKTALTIAITKGDNELGEEIDALNTALDNAIAAYKAADESMKSELSTKIEDADAALQAAIDALSTELSGVKERTAALESKNEELQTFIIIVCVISGVGFCGCATLSVVYFVDKKKRLNK